eukprot:jgi/Mesvir1/18751/Mv01257-RA.1
MEHFPNRYYVDESLPFQGMLLMNLFRSHVCGSVPADLAHYLDVFQMNSPPGNEEGKERGGREVPKGLGAGCQGINNFQIKYNKKNSLSDPEQGSSVGQVAARHTQEEQLTRGAVAKEENGVKGNVGASDSTGGGDRGEGARKKGNQGGRKLVGSEDALLAAFGARLEAAGSHAMLAHHALAEAGECSSTVLQTLTRLAGVQIDVLLVVGFGEEVRDTVFHLAAHHWLDRSLWMLLDRELEAIEIQVMMGLKQEPDMEDAPGTLKDKRSREEIRRRGFLQALQDRENLLNACKILSTVTPFPYGPLGRDLSPALAVTANDPDATGGGGGSGHGAGGGGGGGGNTILTSTSFSFPLASSLFFSPSEGHQVFPGLHVGVVPPDSGGGQGGLPGRTGEAGGGEGTGVSNKSKKRSKKGQGDKGHGAAEAGGMGPQGVTNGNSAAGPSERAHGGVPVASVAPGKGAASDGELIISLKYLSMYIPTHPLADDSPVAGALPVAGGSAGTIAATVSGMQMSRGGSPFHPTGDASSGGRLPMTSPGLRHAFYEPVSVGALGMSAVAATSALVGMVMEGLLYRQAITFLSNFFSLEIEKLEQGVAAATSRGRAGRGTGAGAAVVAGGVASPPLHKLLMDQGGRVKSSHKALKDLDELYEACLEAVKAGAELVMYVQDVFRPASSSAAGGHSYAHWQLGGVGGSGHWVICESPAAGTGEAGSPTAPAPEEQMEADIWNECMVMSGKFVAFVKHLGAHEGTVARHLDPVGWAETCALLSELVAELASTLKKSADVQIVDQDGECEVIATMHDFAQGLPVVAKEGLFGQISRITEMLDQMYDIILRWRSQLSAELHLQTIQSCLLSFYAPLLLLAHAYQEVVKVGWHSVAMAIVTSIVTRFTVARVAKDARGA